MTKEIRVLALQSPQIIINALADDFERQMGYRIRHLLGHADMPIHARQKIDAGEAFDAAFVLPAFFDQLVKEGRLVGATRRNFLRVPIGMAVKAGARKPDINTVEAFKRAVLDAKSIVYLKAGISGPHLDSLFDRFGISAQVQSKAKRPESDICGELVARGDAELAVTAIATLMATPGLDVVGPIPREIQAYVSFAGAVSADAAVPDIAKQLIEFLTGPKAVPVIQSKGMELWA